jgi:hypothetical protein
MTAKRLYYLLLGAIALSIVALLASVYAANLVLEGQAKRVTDAKTKTQVMDEKQRQLTKARADIAKYQPLADIAKSIVPQDKDQSQTVREIVNLAAANGIKLGSITFPSSSLGGKGAADKSQLKAVKGISGVYTQDITVESDGSVPSSYGSFLNFLDALEHNRRTALVSGISLQPDAEDPSTLTFTLNLSEYIKP